MKNYSLKFGCFLLGLLLPLVFVGLSYALPSTGCWTAKQPLERIGTNSGYYDGDQINPNIWCPQYGGVWVSVGPNNFSHMFKCEVDSDCDGYPDSQDLCPTEGDDAYKTWDWDHFDSTGNGGTTIWYSPSPNEACTEDPDPDHCFNGQFDPDLGENFTDCEGTCSAVCFTGCPDGSTYGQVPQLTDDGQATGDMWDICWWEGNTAPGTAGNCPYGYTWNSDLGECTSWSPARVGSEDFLNGTTGDDPNEPFEISYTPKVETEKASSEVDNGDGTKTLTEVELTKVYNEDNTVTNIQTTTTTIIDTATNQPISSDSSTTTWEGRPADGITDADGDGEPDAAGENDPLGVGEYGAFDGGGGLSDEGRYNSATLNWQPIKDATDDLMTRVPFSGLLHIQNFFDTWIVEPVTPEFVIDFIPGIEEKTMSLSLIDPLAGFFRLLMASLSGVLGVYAAIRPWRG